jgi:hypothetical protein
MRVIFLGNDYFAILLFCSKSDLLMRNRVIVMQYTWKTCTAGKNNAVKKGAFCIKAKTRLWKQHVEKLE